MSYSQFSDDFRNTLSELICKKCGQVSPMLVNGRCVNCSPFSACVKCESGTYRSKPKASWQNRWVCDSCGHERIA